MEDAGGALLGDADVAIGEVVQVHHRPLIVAVADEVDRLLLLGRFEPPFAETLLAAVDAAGANDGAASGRERGLLLLRTPCDDRQRIGWRRFVRDIESRVAADPDARGVDEEGVLRGENVERDLVESRRVVGVRLRDVKDGVIAAE